MKLAPLPTALTSALAGFASLSLVGALPKITRTGRYLYSDDGSRFYVKGVAYQVAGEFTSDGVATTFVDNLADGAGCTRDLPNLQKLGVNAVRVYSVDSTKNHDVCMGMLNNAGIYVILDLSLPTNAGSILTSNPAWTSNLLDEFIKTINVFSKYNNILAFNIGNEVVIQGQTNAAAFLKAAARDVKAYLTKIQSSALVSYSGVDSSPATLAEYLSCDPTGQGSGSTSIDMFGVNNYEWCGNQSVSTYDSINSAFQNYNVVAYFSEYGCNPTSNQPDRPWTEVAALYSSTLSGIWSGGSAYTYFPTVNKGTPYGMVTLSTDSKTATTSADFDNLVAQYAKVTFINIPAQSAAGATKFGACPASSADLAAPSALPPTPDDAACACLASKLSCVTNPAVENNEAIIGTVKGFVCSQLPPGAPTCADGPIAGNGATGVYGSVSMCDPGTTLSYLFSEYYEGFGKKQGTCDWAKNATINANAGANPPAASAVAAACVTRTGAAAVFTPTAPAGAVAAIVGSPTDTASHGPVQPEASGTISSGPSSSSSSSSGGSGGGSDGSQSSNTSNGAVSSWGEEKELLRGLLTITACVFSAMGWLLV